LKLQIAPEKTREPLKCGVTLPADIIERLQEYAKGIGTVDYTLAQILDQVLPQKKAKRGGKTEGATA
jgi:hypothetical protein